MRQVLSGTGIDTTAAVAAYLAAGGQFDLANLYLIGDYDDPAAVRLTSWQSPLAWPIWGTFTTGVILRKEIVSKKGLEVAELEVTWTPPLTAPSASIATANPYQLAQVGYYDNQLFRCWVTFMPTPGDANTYGAAILFGGRIGKSATKRGQVIFTVNSFLDVVKQLVPTNVVTLTDMTAGYAGATPPPGHASVPQFATIVGSTAGTIIGQETAPNANHIFGTGAMRGWFLVFNGGPGATLARQLVRIVDNQKIVVGATTYNSIILYQPLPWAPTPGVDTFYVSAPVSLNQGALSEVTIAAGGSGYAVNDVLTITGGSGTGATVQVITESGGVITEVGLVSLGSSYVTTTGAASTGGTGTGATFDLVIAPYQGFPYVPAPQQGL